MRTATINRTRRLGCEYELYIPLLGHTPNANVQCSLAELLTRNGLPATSRGYSSAPIPAGFDLCVEYDSSIQGTWEWQGGTFAQIELKTRILTYEEWERIVPRALAICRDVGAQTNRSCGHHVHLSFGEFSERSTCLRSLYNLVLRYENVLYGLVAPSRRDCGYALPLPDQPGLLNRCRTRAAFQRTLSHLPRKSGLNVTHLWQSSPRIELRYHQGTINVEKARHWLRFCLQMVEHAVTRRCQASPQLPNDRRSLEGLLISCGFKPNQGIYANVDPELRETGKWLLERWQHFNGRTPLRPRKSPTPGESG